MSETRVDAGYRRSKVGEGCHKRPRESAAIDQSSGWVRCVASEVLGIHVFGPWNDRLRTC